MELQVLDMKKILYILLCLVMFGSCTEVMDDFDLNTANARFVVEATLSPNQATVVLSKTTSYLNPYDVPYISDAQVTIGFNDTIMTLSEDSAGFYSMKYDFPSETKYSLAVTIDDEFISAESYMPKPIKWDSVTVRISELAQYYEFPDSLGKLYEVLAYMTDSKGEPNYYRIENYKNDTLSNTNPTDDSYFDGQSVQLVTLLDLFKATDTIKIYLKSIDKPSYEYYNSLMMANSYTGFFSAPDNPKTNLVGDALGRFCAYSIDSLIVTFPE